MNPIVRMMKRYIKTPLKYALPLLFIGALVLVSISGCTSSTTQNANSSGGSGSIGVKINSQTTVAQISSTFGTMTTPAAGNTFVVFNVTCTNNNQQNQALGDPLFFKLTTKDGTAYDASGVWATDPSAIKTISNSNPGEHVTGNVAFEIPQSAVPQTLTYSDGLNQVVTNL
jgi:hypothetical protein